MSLGTCIPGMVERGEISKEKGDEMASLYGEMEQQFRRQFGDQAAAAMATDATLKALEGAALLKKRQALAQVRAQQGAIKSMGEFKGGRKDGDPIDPRAAVALFDRDSRAPYSNVEGRRKAVRGRAHAMIDGILADHSRNVLGQIRKPAQLIDIVRELFGQDTGNLSAKELADAWTRSAEMLRQRFNAAGGDIGKLEKWGLPQSHDSRAVRAAGYEAWRADILPRLDRAKMVDTRTGMAFSDQGLELALRDVFETIRTDGWNKRTPGGNAGVGKLANRRSDPRFLIFKSADDWSAYAQKFGAGTAFDAMMGHIDGMSRDIAMMEILGPNPNATVGWLKDTIERSAALNTDPGTKATDKAFAATKQIDRIYDEINGGAGRPENRTLALTFSTIRSLQTAAKLGSAALSAVTDLNFQMSERRFNGLSSASMLRDYVKLFRPGAVEDQKLAVRLGLIANEWGQRAAAQGRYLNEELTGEVARRLAEGVLRLSGLSRWTEAGRWAFGMEFMGHVTDERVKPFDKLEPAFRNALSRYGIGPDGWEEIRKTPLETDRGAEWLKPANVENRELGDRLLEMITSETDQAVPVADLTTRAMINSVAPKGTFIGEVARSALLFKSFGISMLVMKGRRTMEQSAGNAVRYAAGLFIGTTLGGALALQLKAIASGRDPRPMDDAPFWGASILQGGGLGIFGDFLQSAENRFGGGFAETLAGPMIGDAQAMVDAAKSKRPAWMALKLLRQELPGGSLWYAKTAFDRIVTDQIQHEIDPNYRDAWRRMKQRAHDQRTQFYWAPGETAPDHAPALANAIGEKPQ